MKAPCKGCKFRAIGCHSTCAAYIKYSLSRKEELENSNIRSCVYGYIKTNNHRIKRSKGKSFKLGTGENEFYNFLEVVTNVDLGHKKIICLEDAVTGTAVFISPVSCLIEVEEVADE